MHSQAIRLPILYFFSNKVSLILLSAPGRPNCIPKLQPPFSACCFPKHRLSIGKKKKAEWNVETKTPKPGGLLPCVFECWGSFSWQGALLTKFSCLLGMSDLCMCVPQWKEKQPAALVRFLIRASGCCSVVLRLYCEWMRIQELLFLQQHTILISEKNSATLSCRFNTFLLSVRLRSKGSC